MIRLVRVRDETTVADAVTLALSWPTRLRGLIGRASLEPSEGLWLEPCDSVHMMFMRFAIDLLFLQRQPGVPVGEGALAEVLKVVPDLRPWRGLASCRGAQSALELCAGRAAALDLRPGDQLRMLEVSP